MRDAAKEKIPARDFTPEELWLQANYPMTRDNPCLNMTDAEFLAYIHDKVAAFDYEAAAQRDRDRRWGSNPPPLVKD